MFVRKRRVKSGIESLPLPQIMGKATFYIDLYREVQWPSVRASDSGVRGRGFETYLHRVLSLCKIYLLPRKDSGPYNYQKALYTGKHFYLPKNTEKTHARRGLYAMWITILCV